MNSSNLSPAHKYIIKPISDFISKSTTGGILLLVTTLIAMVWANSPWKESYHHFWENELGFYLNGKSYFFNLHMWINDGLMAIFFFVVGLELKREIIGGELSDLKKASLPILAAVGGMIFPAIIYLIFNHQGDAQKGWGIPMATDIAFALGVLYLLGDKVPNSLKVFLTALAIADDLGAVLVIAFFYTSEISLLPLAIGGVILLVLYLSNRLGIRSTVYYSVLGLSLMWAAFFLSGVHATIAGVATAFMMPSTAKFEENSFIKRMQGILQSFKNADADNSQFITEEQFEILNDAKLTVKDAIPPLQRIEHRLHPSVTFFIMPLFALANAGITLSSDLLHDLTSPVALGVALGLIFGKFIGVFGVSFMMIKLKLAQFPTGMKVKHLIGAGILASIGFTMSLFVTELAFKTHPEFVLEAKIAILCASFLAGIVGYTYLKIVLTKERI